MTDHTGYAAPMNRYPSSSFRLQNILYSLSAPEADTSQDNSVVCPDLKKKCNGKNESYSVTVILQGKDSSLAELEKVCRELRLNQAGTLSEKRLDIDEGIEVFNKHKKHVGMDDKVKNLMSRDGETTIGTSGVATPNMNPHCGKRRLSSGLRSGANVAALIAYNEDAALLEPEFAVAKKTGKKMVHERKLQSLYNMTQEETRRSSKGGCDKILESVLLGAQFRDINEPPPGTVRRCSKKIAAAQQPSLQSDLVPTENSLGNTDRRLSGRTKRISLISTPDAILPEVCKCGLMKTSTNLINDSNELFKPQVYTSQLKANLVPAFAMVTRKKVTDTNKYENHFCNSGVATSNHDLDIFPFNPKRGEQQVVH